MGMPGSDMKIQASGDGNAKQIVLDVIKEMSTTNKYVHKTDIWSVLQTRLNLDTFENALNSLTGDGALYSAYDNDIYSISE